MSVILMMLPVILSIIIKYPSIETEIKKFPIRVGLKFELTVFFQLILPELTSMATNASVVLITIEPPECNLTFKLNNSFI